MIKAIFIFCTLLAPYASADFFVLQNKKTSDQWAWVAPTLKSWCSKRYKWAPPLSRKDRLISEQQQFHSRPTTLHKCKGEVTILELGENSYQWVYTYSSKTPTCEPLKDFVCP